MFRNRTANAYARLAAPVLLASLLGACSSMGDWADPTGWFGSDANASTGQSSTADASPTADSGATPDLAGIPPKPAVPSTPDEQKEVANSLAADRTQAQYSAEALQGGTEPVAAPPPPESALPAAAPTPVDQTASAARSSDTSTATTDSAAAPSTATDTSNTQVASTESAAAAPAAAPMSAATPESAQPATTMQVNFAPSHAPALDPSVAQYVPQRILSHYQQTATAASVPGVQGMSSVAAAKPARHKTKPGPADTAAAPAQ
jgi:hypothetical protein